MIRILIADPDSATRKALTLLLQRKLGTGSVVEVGDVENSNSRAGGPTAGSAPAGLEALRLPRA